MPAEPAVAADLPLVMHVVYRFDTGGLENGVVNLVNRLSGYRHAVVALTECVDGFCRRVQRPDTVFISLHKPPGQSLKVAPAFARAVRQWRPAIVHTRNLAALEMQLPAWWAGAPLRVHGEHGRDADDPDGRSRKHRWMRRVFRPWVQQYVALSGDLARYLEQGVGVPAERIQRICNGVDAQRFRPAAARQPLPGSPFNDASWVVFGTVGRMASVKAQTDLVSAFVQACQRHPAMATTARLMLVGEGPLRDVCRARLAEAGLAHTAWLPGERHDVPAVMQALDVFVLPSLAEGISNTVLEAMASGLPVLATRVGGNAELVVQGQTGALVDAGRPDTWVDTLHDWWRDAGLRRQLGQAGRARVEAQFSLDAMVHAYDALYRRMLGTPSAT
jgi:sugar transferase (PEP-CTERM/EpsH1 system associated)